MLFKPVIFCGVLLPGNMLFKNNEVAAKHHKCFIIFYYGNFPEDTMIILAKNNSDQLEIRSNTVVDVCLTGGLRTRP